MNTNDQSVTPSPDSPTPRIYTKCPACGNDTLTVNGDKHLLCTWVSCPDPALIDRVREENATLVEEMKGWRQTILDEVAALVKEREEWINEAVGLQSTLAERDREIEALKEANAKEADGLAGDVVALRAQLAEMQKDKETFQRRLEKALETIDELNEASLTLIEEAREVLAMVEQDHLFPFTVDHDVLLPKVQQLLTRLNPRK